MTVGRQQLEELVKPTDDLRKLVFSHAVASLSETSLVGTKTTPLVFTSFNIHNKGEWGKLQLSRPETDLEMLAPSPWPSPIEGEGTKQLPLPWWERIEERGRPCELPPSYTYFEIVS